MIQQRVANQTRFDDRLRRLATEVKAQLQEQEETLTEQRVDVSLKLTAQLQEQTEKTRKKIKQACALAADRSLAS